MKKRGTLITLGSFDGVHRGHSALIERTVFEAHKRKLKPMALTFNAPPRMILQPHNPLTILSTEFEKSRLLKSSGIEEVVFLDFDKKFSQINPFYFFKYILLKEFNAKGLVVGMDFRFGVNRSAGVHELVRWGEEYEIPVWVIPAVKYSHEVVSSSNIRLYLQSGKYQKAMNLLNHPYLIHGEIVHGRGIGKKIGFPTANLKIEPGKVLPLGVYAVKAQVFNRSQRPIKVGASPEFIAVCNIGTRPTFLRKKQVVVEVHGLAGNIPSGAASMSIELHRFLRLEKKFSSTSSLQKSIQKDILRTRSFFRDR